MPARFWRVRAQWLPRDALRKLELLLAIDRPQAQLHGIPGSRQAILQDCYETTTAPDEVDCSGCTILSIVTLFFKDEELRSFLTKRLRQEVYGRIPRGSAHLARRVSR